MLTVSIAILLVSGCGSLNGNVQKPKTDPVMLTVPNLESSWENDIDIEKIASEDQKIRDAEIARILSEIAKRKGGICMDKPDSASVLHYIERLESAASE